MRPAVRSSRKTPEQQSFSLCSDLWHLKICFSPLSTTFCVCTRTSVCVCRQGKGCVFLGTARGRKYAATGGHGNDQMLRKLVPQRRELFPPPKTSSNSSKSLCPVGVSHSPPLITRRYSLLPFRTVVWLVNVIILRRTKRQQKVKFSQP